MGLSEDIIYHRKLNVQEYLTQGNSLDDLDDYGFTPLIEAAIASNVEAATLLLEHGANIDKPDVTGRTPLHWAIDNQHQELSELFLQYKANPNAYTKGGQSVLVFPLLRRQTGF